MIQKDTSKSGWGAFCNGVLVGGKGSENEENLHANILELTAAKFVILTFIKGQSNIAIQLQIENKTAFSYLLKVEGYIQQRTLAHHQVHSDLPSQQMNCHASRVLSQYCEFTCRLGIKKHQGQFRMKTRCFSFTRDCNTHGTIISESVCIQTLLQTFLIHCMESRPRQYSNRCIPAFLGQGVWFRFSSIQFDKLGSNEDPGRNYRSPNHSDTTWQTQPWYARLLKMFVQPPFLLPLLRNFLRNPLGKNHCLIEIELLVLPVLKISRKVCKWKEFQVMLTDLSHIQG